jgi:hypothetical protein
MPHGALTRLAAARTQLLRRIQHQAYLSATPWHHLIKTAATSCSALLATRIVAVSAVWRTLKRDLL